MMWLAWKHPDRDTPAFKAPDYIIVITSAASFRVQTIELEDPGTGSIPLVQPDRKTEFAIRIRITL